MADTTTANYGFVKPEINGSPNTWGNKLNGNWDSVDAHLSYTQLQAAYSIKKSGYTTSDDLIVNALRYSTSVVLYDNRDLVYLEFMKSCFMRTCPKGEVTLWGGTLASIPLGFVFCDGNTYNGIVTPDLRNRFVFGAGGYLPGGIGGTWTHNHGGVVGDTALTEYQMPWHTHGVYDPGHGHVMNDPGHGHNAANGLPFQTIGNGPNNLDYIGGVNQTVGVAVTTTNSSNVWVSNGGTGIGIYATGSGGAHNHTIASADSFPPFYVLAYIMRAYYPWEF